MHSAALRNCCAWVKFGLADFIMDHDLRELRVFRGENSTSLFR